MTRTYTYSLLLVTWLLAPAAGLGGEPKEQAQPPGPPPEVTLEGTRYALLHDCKHKAYDLTLTVEPAGKTNPALDVLFGLAKDGSRYYHFVARGGSAELSVLETGKRRLLARASLPLAAGARHLSIRRRERALYLLVNGALAADVLDTTCQSGVVALAVSAGKVAAKRYQPYGGILFADDFMRTEKEQDLGGWARVSGEWKFHSVKELHARASFQHSANPFSLGGKVGAGKPEAGEPGKAPAPKKEEAKAAAAEESPFALVTAGYGFWDNYDVQTSLKSQGSTSGLVFGFLDKDNFHLLRWALTSFRRIPRAIELLRMREGKLTEIAQGYAIGGSDQWYRLGVRLQGRRIQTFLDGALLFDVVEPVPLQGGVGLYVEGPAETHFDDVVLRPSLVYPFDTEAVARQYGLAVSGKWSFRAKADQPNRCAQYLDADGGRPANYVFGGSSWSDYVFSMKAKLRPGTQLALLFGERVACVWGQAPAGREFLSEPAAALPALAAGQWHELELNLLEPQRLRVYVDGVLEFRAPRPPDRHGRPGLWVHSPKEEPAVASFEAVTVAFEKEDDWEQPVKNAIFMNDPFMKHWSSAEGAWIPVGLTRSTFWHKGDFFGALAITVPLRDDLRLLFCAEQRPEGVPDFSRDFSLHVSRDEQGAHVRLLKNGEAIRTCDIPDIPDDAPGIRLHKDGKYLWLSLGDEELLSYRDERLVRGTTMALCSAELLAAEDFAALDVQRNRVRDDPFEKALADWVRIGTWEVTNRFACYPIWSHLNGRGRGDAILWQKVDFEGDLTLEYYAGMRMRQSTEMLTPNLGSYPRIGDLNAAFCCKSLELDTGYAFTPAGWDPYWSERWTNLFRNGVVVRRTDRRMLPRTRERRVRALLPWVAAGRDIHGAWYYVKIRKIGNRLEYYLDNELVEELSYTDPEPLTGKKLAIWTYDNSMMVARVKISYQKRSAPDPLVPAPPREPAPCVEPTLVVTSDSHPGCYHDFEHTRCGWKTTSDDQGAFLSLEKSDERSYLRLTNSNSGGDFGALIPLAKTPIARVTDFELDYCISEDVRVNFYFDIGGETHFVRFTGLDDSAETTKRVGRIEGVVTDGQWHHLRFDLAAAFAERFPLETDTMIENLRIGNFHEGYLEAGFGGNHEGASYALDNFTVVTVAEGPPQIQWQGPDSSTEVACSFAWDRAPLTVPDDKPDPAESKEQSPPKEDGLWYFHIRAQLPDGAWSPPLHHPARIQSEPLAVTGFAPPSGADWSGETIALQLAPKIGPNVQLDTVWVHVNGQEVRTDNGTVRQDCRRKVLALDLSHCGLSFEEGEQVELAARFLSVTGHSSEASWHYTFRKRADSAAPNSTKVQGYLLEENSFEEGLGTWSATGSTADAIVARDPTTAASGEYSLKLFNRYAGGAFLAYAYNDPSRPLDVGRFPLLSFDYRIEPHVKVDIGIQTLANSDLVQIGFTDRDVDCVAPLEGIRADGQWHRAEVNLRDLLKNQPYHPQMYQVSQIVFGDWGSVVNGMAHEYNIDNFRLIPVRSSLDGLRLNWQASDPSGLRGYSCHWSRSPHDEPDGLLDGVADGVTFINLPEGELFFHLRAQDAIGNWGRTLHSKFLVDNTPPKVLDPAGFAPKLAFKMIDRCGVAPDSLRIAIDGQPYALSDFFTAVDAERQVLTWDWPAAQGNAPRPVPDGTERRFTAGPFRDFAGNSTPTFRWDWTVRYAEDHEPPTMLAVKGTSHPILSRDTFSRSLGGWANYGGSRRGCSVFTHYDAERKDYCLRVVDPNCTAYGGTYVRAAGYDATKFPIISFEYKIPPQAKLHFMFQVNGAWRGVTVTVPCTYPNWTNVGAAGVKADGHWRGACFNLLEMLKKNLPKATSFTVSNLIIADYYRYYSPAGTEYFIDNFMISGAGKKEPVFQLSAVDPTGIGGFSYLLDKQPETCPSPIVGFRDTELKLPALAEVGPWYLHLRACDGAGNWSQTVHYPYYVEKPPSAKAAPKK